MKRLWAALLVLVLIFSGHAVECTLSQPVCRPGNLALGDAEALVLQDDWSSARSLTEEAKALGKAASPTSILPSFIPIQTKSTSASGKS